jgi:hypothetical protein
MHDNISQISRWWLAKSLLLHHVDPFLFEIEYEHPKSSHPPTWNRSSNPAHLAMLIQPQKSYQMNNSTADPTTFSDYNNATSISPPIVLPSEHMTPSYSCPHTVSFPKEIQDIMSINPIESRSSQQKMTDWTIHTPFISGIKLSATSNDQVTPSLSYNPQNPLHLQLPHNPETSNSPIGAGTPNLIHSPPNSPRQLYLDHLSPYGTPLPPIDTSKILRICMQNSQHSFQIYGDTINLPPMVGNFQSIGANMYVPISPNINWHTSSTWPRIRHLFCPHFHQVHLSTVSRDIGKSP